MSVHSILCVLLSLKIVFFFFVVYGIEHQIGLLGGSTLTSTSVIAQKMAEIKKKLQLFLYLITGLFASNGWIDRTPLLF